MTKELSIYLIILICVIFLQIDSFFLEGYFIGRQLSLTSHFIWGFLTFMTIIRILEIIFDNINHKK